MHGTYQSISRKN